MIILKNGSNGKDTKRIHSNSSSKGFYWDNGKENGNHFLGFRGYILVLCTVGIREKKMETTTCVVSNILGLMFCDSQDRAALRFRIWGLDIWESRV